MITSLIGSVPSPVLTLALCVAVVATIGVLARGRRQPDMHSLSPHAFERAVGAWLARDGWLVEHRGGSGDEGLDLLAFHGEQLVAVQCKRYAATASVTPAQVRELYGAAVAVGATVAVMATTGRVSAASRTWAANLPSDGPQFLFWSAEVLGTLSSAHVRFRPQEASFGHAL